ncbi:MAG: hypothetical protein M9958_04220 [Chitinophagales bacterium]|nr:hypothetical protein [Chitinophagales bacterium]
MRKFKIQYIFFALTLLLVSACKKDTVKKPDISNGDDRDIRITKVQYLGHDFNPLFFFSSPTPLMYTKECTYHYDSDGRLSYIMNDDILRVQVEYSHEQIIVSNNVEQEDKKIASYWDHSIISYQNNKIRNIIINAFSPGFVIEASIDQRSMIVKRESDGRLKSVMDDGTFENEWFFPLSTQVLSYNENGLPYRLVGSIVLDIKKTLPLPWDFTYQYNKADDVPTKLKRLVNEELLLSTNIYGIANYDIYYIDSSRHLSQFGEGNWLISFGLPEYYILEEKSTHLVSKRTTDYYQLDSLSGDREFIKNTKVEDFPYKHDAEAKTLEIAGLKIWYEFVE